MLVALEPLLSPKGKGRLSKTDYTNAIARHGGSSVTFKEAYLHLHLLGGYDGTRSAATIKKAMEYAKQVIDWAARKAAHPTFEKPRHGKTRSF